MSIQPALLALQELIARGDTAEAASNAETAVTQLVQLFTIRAQARIWAKQHAIF